MSDPYDQILAVEIAYSEERPPHCLPRSHLYIAATRATSAVASDEDTAGGGRPFLGLQACNWKSLRN
jgi:hypothetical protein